MKSLNACPKVLRQKVILTQIVGAGCLAVGGVYYLAVRDGVFLVLSALIFAFSLYRGFSLWAAVVDGRYEVVEGTCTAVSAKPFRKHITVKIQEMSGAESTLRLGKHTRLKIGKSYRFFFSHCQNPTLGSEYFDAALSSGGFLGCEDLEIFAPKESATDE